MTRYGGIDLGGTKIQAVVTDEHHQVLGAARHRTPTTGGPADVAAEIVAALNDAATEAGITAADLNAVGVGSPGVVDDEAGTVTSARNLPGWEGSFDLRGAIDAACGAPVALGNDVNVATDAEFHLGAGKPYRSMLGVFWGTGVGGALVLDGKLWEGRGAAGEIGHMCIKLDGAVCPCGRRGCMEAYAGRGAMEAYARAKVNDGAKTVLFKLMEEKGRPRLASGIWARALDRGDKLAVEIVNRAVKALGAGIASALNLVDVEVVIIGGGLGDRLGQPYVDRIRDAMMPHLFADQRPPEVLAAALGDYGGATGATLLAASRMPAHA
jgi:glucokinase